MSDVGTNKRMQSEGVVHYFTLLYCFTSGAKDTKPYEYQRRRTETALRVTSNLDWLTKNLP